MNITLFAYIISAIVSAIFTIRIYIVKKKYPDDIAKHFYVFFLFGFLYFFIRSLAILFFFDNKTILSLSYPISHIFLYLSFAYMLDTAIDLSSFKRYSKKILWIFIFFGFFVIYLNVILPNNPSLDLHYSIISWGTNKIVSIFHIIYAFSAILALTYIFILQAFKSKPFNKKFFIIGFGFFFLTLNAFKNAFHQGIILYFFEFTMIIGISIIVIGLAIKEKK